MAYRRLGEGRAEREEEEEADVLEQLLREAGLEGGERDEAALGGTGAYVLNKHSRIPVTQP